MSTTQTQVLTLVGTFVSAVLALVAGIDPGSFLAKPLIQGEVLGVFTAGIPLGFFLWMLMHHSAAVARISK